LGEKQKRQKEQKEQKRTFLLPTYLSAVRKDFALAFEQFRMNLTGN
jgi:hypothetical protein